MILRHLHLAGINIPPLGIYHILRVGECSYKYNQRPSRSYGRTPPEPPLFMLSSHLAAADRLLLGTRDGE